MLIAGGIYFGLDAFAIFKHLAGFANAINATSEEELDDAGQHLASAVAGVGVDIVMTLLTSKVANKVAGIDKPGTTTGDLDDINHSIRRHNAPEGRENLYTVEDVGNEIVNNSLATKAYQRINDQGFDVRINHDYSDKYGFTKFSTKNVEIYDANHRNAKEAVGTIVHESTHVEYRYKKRIPNNTQYEEYRAAVREATYHRSNNHSKQSRPTLEERKRI